MQLIILTLILDYKINLTAFWQIETAFTKIQITLYKITLSSRFLSA